MEINVSYTTLVMEVIHEGFKFTVQVENFGNGWIVSRLNPVKGMGFNEVHSGIRSRYRKEVERAVIEWCGLNARVVK